MSRNTVVYALYTEHVRYNKQVSYYDLWRTANSSDNCIKAIFSWKTDRAFLWLEFYVARCQVLSLCHEILNNTCKVKYKWLPKPHVRLNYSSRIIPLKTLHECMIRTTIETFLTHVLLSVLWMVLQESHEPWHCYH